MVDTLFHGHYNAPDNAVMEVRSLDLESFVWRKTVQEPRPDEAASVHGTVAGHPETVV